MPSNRPNLLTVLENSLDFQHVCWWKWCQKPEVWCSITPLLICAPDLSTSWGIRAHRLLFLFHLALDIFLSCTCRWYTRQSWQHFDVLVYYKARLLLNAIFILKEKKKGDLKITSATYYLWHTDCQKETWLPLRGGTCPSPLPSHLTIRTVHSYQLPDLT